VKKEEEVEPSIPEAPGLVPEVSTSGAGHSGVEMDVEEVPVAGPSRRQGSLPLVSYVSEPESEMDKSGDEL
jgi:hypothetical protein